MARSFSTFASASKIPKARAYCEHPQYEQFVFKVPFATNSLFCTFFICKDLGTKLVLRIRPISPLLYPYLTLHVLKIEWKNYPHINMWHTESVKMNLTVGIHCQWNKANHKSIEIAILLDSIHHTPTVRWLPSWYSDTYRGHHQFPAIVRSVISDTSLGPHLQKLRKGFRSSFARTTALSQCQSTATAHCTQYGFDSKAIVFAE